MNCPRCAQPMHSRSWRHRDGHTDTKHTCRNHLCRYKWQERCDATPAMVAAMRSEFAGNMLRPGDMRCADNRLSGEIPHAAVFDSRAQFSNRLPYTTAIDHEPHRQLLRDSNVLTATTEGLDALAEQHFGLKRAPGETCQELRERCIAALGKCAPGGQWRDSLTLVAEAMRRVDASGWQTAKVELPRHATTIVDEQMPIGWIGCTPLYEAKAAPKSQREVKVGDVLIDPDGFSRTVRAVDGRHTYAAVATGCSSLDLSIDGMRDAGWTHADGAAIAEALPEPRIIGHTTGGDLVLGVAKSQPMPACDTVLDLGSINSIMRTHRVQRPARLLVREGGTYYDCTAWVPDCDCEVVYVKFTGREKSGKLSYETHCHCTREPWPEYFNYLSAAPVAWTEATTLPAPRPPREVKVGDMLLNAVGQSARKVLGIERGRLLLCYCGNGVDESVATASYLFDDVKPLGWTFADTGEAV